MKRFRLLLAMLAGFAFLSSARAQDSQGFIVTNLTENGSVEFRFDQNLVVATNGVLVEFGGAVLTAESVTVNESSGEVTARGKVHLERDDQTWNSEQLRYNFKTKELEAEKFRTGKPPAFAAGEGLHGELNNQVYAATNAYITGDDVAQPAVKIRARYLRIIPGKKLIAKDAFLYFGNTPVFYFPYYSRDLGAHAGHFTFLPGYRSSFGPYFLGGYNWFLNDQLDGEFHFDYRLRRGPGVGPDFNYHLGPWGDGSLRYYYTHDDNPNVGSLPGTRNPENRERVYFSYLGTPNTNLNLRAMVQYQGHDTNILREFFESEYRQNPQPSTYFEVNKFWNNWSLDAYAQPRVNDFLETVERLPEVRLTGFRQELLDTPVYYESESSLGYYRRLFADTNSFLMPDYSAGRADSYHQLTLPQTLFGWLNVAPRVGGRFTWYSEADGPGATTDEQTRGVFNTGAEVSFKTWKLWPNFKSAAFDMDGLRHILEPSINYVYVPRPNVLPYQLPQFDYELPSLRLLPIEFPDYNAIDSIDSENVFRFGLHNRLQTKRDGQIADVLDWNLYTDWRVRPDAGQSTFADLYSDTVARPQSWLTLESLVRYDVEDGLFRMAFHTVTFQPTSALLLTFGHFYLRDDLSGTPTALGVGNNLLTSAVFYRLNENWGLRASHYFEARTGVMQEQAYSVYRDMRSWTGALTLRLRDNPYGPEDVTVAFTFSLKAFPRYGLGSDVATPYSLWGN